jgi:hypothetical protein
MEEGARTWFCGNLRIDLRAGHGRFRRCWVAGRITVAANGSGAGQIPILIIAGQRILAAGFSSEDGVFLHSFPAAREEPLLVISIEERQQALVVPLWRLFPDAPEASERRFQASN